MIIGDAPWRELAVPDPVANIPNMLAQEEQQYLIWIASELRTGWGAVVDLGPWLGCSSAALAEGIRQSRGGVQVQSLDLFEWRRDYMEKFCPANLAEGSDFRPLFRQQTAAYSDAIDPQRMDLLAGEWTKGSIEILFVDAAKTWGLTNAILRVFGPSLVPGKSVVVIQDFKHMPTYWLPLIFDSRPDLWEELHDLVDGDTVSYRLRAPLDASAGAEANFSKDSFTADQVYAIYRNRIEHRAGKRIGPSFYRAMLEYGRKAVADEFLVALLAGLDEKTRRQVEGLAAAARSAWRAAGMQPLWDALVSGNIERAEQLIEVFDSPDDPRCSEVRGRIAQLRGDHRTAIEWFERSMIGQGPVAVPTVLFAATSRVAVREFDAVTEDLVELLLREDPMVVHQRKWALFILRSCWDAQRAQDKARAACVRLLARFSNDPDVLVLAALVDRETGREESARKMLEKAAGLDPTNAEVKSMLGSG